MKEKYKYDYTSGDFKEQYYMLEDYGGDRLLLVAAVDRGNLNIARHAIKHGASVNANNGLPLKTAIQKENLHIVKYLVQNGADVNIDRGLPIMAAVRKGNLDIMKYLTTGR